MFFPCLRILKADNVHQWIEKIGHLPNDAGMFAGLSKDQCQTVLDTFVGFPSIEFETKSVLVSIAEQFPVLVVEWFGERIALSGSNSVENYSPVPFEVHDLGEVLAPNTEKILETLRDWHSDPDKYEFWDVSHFLSRINPGLGKPLPKVLETKIDTSDSDTLLFIVSVLAGYQGNESLFPLYRKALQSPSITTEVGEILERRVFEAGLMAGYAGAAETYQRKIDLLNTWLDDDSERVSQFAKKRIATLEKRVALETRRAREEIALRRLEFDEDVVGEPGNE